MNRENKRGIDNDKWVDGENKRMMDREGSQ